VRRIVDGAEARRSYSICAAPATSHVSACAKVADGVVSNWWCTSRAGDEIEALPPSGPVRPDLTTSGHHVLIAAGSGITPMLSIAASVLRNPASRVSVVYGNRRTDTVMFADDLADLKDSLPQRITLTHVPVREARTSSCFSGRLRDQAARVCCRSCATRARSTTGGCAARTAIGDRRPAGAARTRRARGVHPSRAVLRRGRRPAAGRPRRGGATGPSSQVTSVLDGRATRSRSPDRTVLEGAQRVRPDLPFGLQGRRLLAPAGRKVVSGEGTYAA